MKNGLWLVAALALGTMLVASPPAGIGQTPPPPPPPPGAPPAAPAASFSEAQLEQLVAPIALYPDSLLTQTLMASTYPLEIVEAARWLKKNPSLKDAALTEALKGQDWDPSVKSICGFPEVLKKMDENLDWTQDLGDAFLGQQEALLKTVQKMRGKAYESGNLKTTEQQKVTQSSETVIIIEPAQPEVIYVPTYSPTVVYAGWSYPSYYYPAYYAPYPPGAGLVTFTAGVAFGAAVWGNCDWGHNDVDIDIDRYNNFNRNTSVNAERYNRSGSGTANWEHNAEHRRGVNYQNSQTAQKYGGSGSSSQVTRDQARGKQPGQGQGQGGGGREPGTRPSGGGERPTTLPSGGSREPGSRPSGGGERPTTLPSGGGDRPSAGTADRQPGAGASAGTRDAQKPSGSGASQRPTSSDRSASKPSGGSAYSGSSKPKADAAASSRGSSSRGSSSYSGSKSSGASRPSSSSASRPPSGGSRSSGGGGSRPSGGGGSRGGGGRR